jgi:hypothetical protein
MEGKKKKPEATPPRVARVLKLLDKLEESEEPKEPEIPQVKRRKLVKASNVELTLVAPIEPSPKATKDKGGFAAFLAARRKTGLKHVICLVERIRLFYLMS